MGSYPAGCGRPSLLRHDDGGVDQKLVARVELKWRVEMVKTQAAA